MSNTGIFSKILSRPRIRVNYDYCKEKLILGIFNYLINGKLGFCFPLPHSMDSNLD